MRRASKHQRDLKARAVRDLDVADALRVVDNSGIAEVLERDMKQQRGRPRKFAWRSVLALLILAAFQQESGVHMARTQYVFWGLTKRQRALLGLGDDTSNSGIDGYLNDLLDATCEAVDVETGEVFPPHISVPEIELLNGLLQGAMGCIEKPDGALAIDSMPVESWARRRGHLRDTAEQKEKRARQRRLGKGVSEPPHISEPGWPKLKDNGK
ncbi:hypothetical protein [uncultured Tessaracoccus sp.]|uniref:hypothetical protein n=1 Tax=uncultured Tessaracoccus sp. TaxID=905023 RepID=UPI002603CA80|nr:hypothetical protein [uncultured Tessaracoccus sp.]